MNLTNRCHLKLVRSLITGKQFEIIALQSECSPPTWGWTVLFNFMKIAICAPERQIRPNFQLVWTVTLFVMKNKTLNPFVLYRQRTLVCRSLRTFQRHLTILCFVVQGCNIVLPSVLKNACVPQEIKASANNRRFSIDFLCNSRLIGGGGF